VWFIKLLQFKPIGTSWPHFPQVSEVTPQGGQGHIMTQQKHQAIRLGGWSRMTCNKYYIFGQILQNAKFTSPKHWKVLLMIKALNRKTLWLWSSNFLLFHVLRTILFQTFKYSINNKFNFSKCRVLWPPAPSLVNYMRMFIDESNKETHAIVSLGDAPRPFWMITLSKWVQSCFLKGYIWTTIK
jgi:hypothetical protein